MAMRVELGDMDGLALLHWEVHEDERAAVSPALYCRAALAEAGLPFEVVQVNVSRNPPATPARLHFQQPPPRMKIVAYLRGRIWDVAVDMRRSRRPTGNARVRAERRW